MAYSDLILKYSPSLYFKLDEASGSTLTDSSGNSRNGTITTTTYVTYQESQLIVDGSYSMKQTAPASPTLGARLKYTFGTNVTTKPYTVLLWVKINTFNSGTDHTCPTFFSTNNYEIMLGCGTGGATTLELYNGSTYPTGSTSLSTSTVYMVTAVATSSGTDVYLNTTREINDTSRAVSNGTTALLVGYRPDAGFKPYAFDGWMDEVAVFDKALTAQDIAVIYNAGKGARILANRPRANQAVNRAATG